MISKRSASARALVPLVIPPMDADMQKSHMNQVQQNRYMVMMLIKREVRNMERTVEMEAAGPGAAGTLTGPNVEPRQAQ